VSNISALFVTKTNLQIKLQTIRNVG